MFNRFDNVMINKSETFGFKYHHQTKLDQLLLV